MEVKDIEKRIKSEERHIRRVRAKIEDLRFDISATIKALEYWRGQLKQKKGGR